MDDVVVGQQQSFELNQPIKRRRADKVDFVVLKIQKLEIFAVGESKVDQNSNSIR